MININTLKDRFISASIVEKLIYINIAVFILTFIFQLFQDSPENQINWFVDWFS